MKFPLNAIIGLVVAYISNIVATVLPDELDEKQKVWMQSTIGSLYAIAKNFGQQLVAGTENDLDDKVLKEIIQVCEEASIKYGLELNAENVTPGMVVLPIPTDG